MGFRSELIENTGWIGVILLGLCLAKMFIKGGGPSIVKQKHKLFGWLAFFVLSVHGLLAYNLILPVAGRGNHYHLLAQFSSGQISWLILLIMSASSVLLSYQVFKKYHFTLVLFMGIILLFHVV